MSRHRVPLTAVLPDARDRHRSAPVLPKPQLAPRETSPYRLPDGRIVLIYEDVARGAATVTYGMLADGKQVVVNAERVSVPYDALAAKILTTVNEWAAEGATADQLRACIADILDEELS